MNEINKIVKDAEKLVEKVTPKRLVFDETLVASSTERELRSLVNFFLQFKPHFVENSPNLEEIKHLTKLKE